MTANILPSILKTRLLVGYLGERAQFAWWPTAFYETSSSLFLEPVFSRTSLLTQYHGVLEAARRLHDEHLSVGSYHLFRLPEEVEEDLHNLARRPEDVIRLDALRSKDAAMESLRELGDALSPKSSIGPTAVGRIEDLQSPITIQAIAAVYLSAFDRHVQAYPYLARRP